MGGPQRRGVGGHLSSQWVKKVTDANAMFLSYVYLMIDCITDVSVQRGHVVSLRMFFGFSSQCIGFLLIVFFESIQKRYPSLLSKHKK